MIEFPSSRAAFCSAAFRSLMSLATTETPVMRPSASRTGETVTEAFTLGALGFVVLATGAMVVVPTVLEFFGTGGTALAALLFLRRAVLEQWGGGLLILGYAASAGLVAVG